jgi:hypothetical protein
VTFLETVERAPPVWPATRAYRGARSAGDFDLNHLGLGKLSRRTTKREQAREHLTIATTMYREMDMRFWLAQAEAEAMELGA